jgi:hypothetical protein
MARLPSFDRADAAVYAFAPVNVTPIDVERDKGVSIAGDLVLKAW